MNREKTPPDKDFEIRCPRLGHMITFVYCRLENRGSPCFKTLDCWYQHFPVEEHLRLELSPEQWDEVFRGPSKPKVLSLVELIEQAKKRKKEIAT
jgi:hypothetical protein